MVYLLFCQRLLQCTITCTVGLCVARLLPLLPVKVRLSSQLMAFLLKGNAKKSTLHLHMLLCCHTVAVTVCVAEGDVSIHGCQHTESPFLLGSTSGSVRWAIVEQHAVFVVCKTRVKRMKQQMQLHGGG